MAVVYKQLASRYGFTSPGFAVDSTGNIDIAGDLTYNGEPVITNGTINSGSGDLIADQIVTINASPTGSINNVVIGATTARAGTFTDVTATTVTAPTVSASTVTITQPTTNVNHAATKKYVDTRAIAMSIAMS
jgi:predicted transcriptional regulator